MTPARNFATSLLGRRSPIDMLLVTIRILFTLALAAGSACGDSPATVAPTPAKPTVRALFCATGGVGSVPVPTPADFESRFAVAVVEIDSPSRLETLVPAFTVIAADGAPLTTRRVVEVERFDRVPSAAEGTHAFFLNAGGTTAWDGVVPPGTMRLRIRIALENSPAMPAVCRVDLGSAGAPLVVERDLDGVWPT
jgi:hypothetical protein